MTDVNTNPPKVEEDKDGWFVDTLKGIAQGPIEAIKETGEFIADVNDATNDWFEKNTGGSKLYFPDSDGDGKANWVPKWGTEKDMAEDFSKTNRENKSFNQMLQNAELFGKDRSTIVGGMSQSFSQFIAGVIGVSKVTKLKMGKSIIGGMAVGAPVDGMMFDPYEANAVRALDEMFGIKIPYLTDILSNKIDDGKWENRVKNTIVGSGIGGTIDVSLMLTRGTISTIRHLKNKRVANEEFQTNGSISETTVDNLEASEVELKEFMEEVDGPPKGVFTENGTRLVLEDGKVINTETTARVVDEEIPVIPTAKLDEIVWNSTDGPQVVTPINGDFGKVDLEVNGNLVPHQTVKIDATGETKLVEVSSLSSSVKVDTSVPGGGAKAVDDTIKTAGDGIPAITANLDDSAETIGGAGRVDDAPGKSDGKVDPEVEVGGTDNPRPKVDGTEYTPPKFIDENLNTPKGSPGSLINTNETANILIAARASPKALGPVDPEAFLDIALDRTSGYINPKVFDAGPEQLVTAVETLASEMTKNTDIRKALKLDNVQSNKETVERGFLEYSKLIGEPIPKIKKYVGKTAWQLEDATVRVFTNKAIIVHSLKEVDRLSDEIIKAGKEIDTLKEKQLIAWMETAADAMSYTKVATREAARLTQSGRIKVLKELGEQSLDKIAQYGGSAKVKKLAEQLRLLKGNAVGQAKVIKKAGKNKFWGVVNEVWINGILSGFKTHALNITSGAFNILIRPGIRVTGGVLTGNGRAVEAGARQYAILMGEIADSLMYLTPFMRSSGESALQAGWKALKTESGVLDTSSKFDFDTGAAIGGNSVLNVLGKTIRLSSRFLKAEDEVLKQLVFRSHLRAAVMTDARRMSLDQIQTLGYGTKDEFIQGEIKKATLAKEVLAEKWEEMVAYGHVLDDPKGKEKWISENLGLSNKDSLYAERALFEARETTYTTPLDDGFTKGFQAFANQYPALKMLFPFVQTPTNVLRTAVERTPLFGLMIKNNWQKLRKGTPEERALVAGNQAYGVAATAIALNYAMQGKITGGGPSYFTDPGKAVLWNKSPDWQPYSINIGTDEKPQWIELRRLDPHGTLIGIIGDAYEMGQYLGKEDPEIAQLIGMVGASIANNISQKTWLAGFEDLMTVMKGDAKWWELKKMTSTRVSSMIPFSGLQMQLNQANNDQLREMRTFADQIRARVYSPLAEAVTGEGYNNLTVKHDWLTGEAIDTPDYMLSYIRSKKLEKGELKAAEVYKEIRKLNATFNGPQRKIDGDLELSPEVFQRYNELVGTVKNSAGRTLLDQLILTINSDRYDKEGKEIPYGSTDVSDDHRVNMLNRYISGYKKLARRELFKEFPELMDSVRHNKKVSKMQSAGRPGADELEKIFKFPPNP